MEPSPATLLAMAQQGDIEAFQQLFAGFQDQLRAYLYRLLANRSDAEDLTHDTFIQGFRKIDSFSGKASLKTWIFQIATNLALNYLRKRNRWSQDVLEQGKQLALSTPTLMAEVVKAGQDSPENTFEMRHHIDTCFTCMGKTLPVEQQVAVILKDMYDFSVAEIASVLEKSEGVVKHLLIGGRGTLAEVFEQRCALVNKQGVCNQCSELNGLYNPRQDQQAERNRLDLVKGSSRFDREKLYAMRVELVKGIDPLRCSGANIQEVLMRCNALAMGEEGDAG